MSERRSGEQGEVPARLVLGVELRSRSIGVALVDLNGELKARIETPVPPKSGTRKVVGLLADLLLKAASSRERGARRVGGIAISVDGWVDPETERVTVPADEEGWRGGKRIDLATKLAEALAESGYDIALPAGARRTRADRHDPHHLPIDIFPRPAALAAAEIFIGRARGRRNVVYLAIDDEVEAGIIIGGRYLPGAAGLAGSVGWFPLGDSTKQIHRQRGAFTSEIGADSYQRYALEEWNGEAGSLLGELLKSTPTTVSPETIFRAARGSDPLALQIVDRACRRLGCVAAALQSILNPELIVLGGRLGPLYKPFLDDIHTEAESWLSPEYAKSWRLSTSSPDPGSGIIGAVALVGMK